MDYTSNTQKKVDDVSFKEAIIDRKKPNAEIKNTSAEIEEINPEIKKANNDNASAKKPSSKKSDGVASSAKVRNSSFELLRIISMLMIIGHHLVVHGNFSTASTLNSWVLTILEFGGKFGVIIFMLISSYFLINTKFTIRKLIKLMLQVWFYSIVLYVISIFLNGFEFSAKRLAYAVLPVVMVEYWFVTCYVFIFLLSPFLNKMLKSHSQSEHGWLIVIMLFCYTVLRFAMNISSVFFMFIIIYMIGSYLRLYPIKELQKFSILIPSFLLLYFSLIILQHSFSYNFFEVDRLLMLLCAINFFMMFEKIKFHSKVVNIMASSTFGIYLLHDNINISPYLWNNIFHTNSFAFDNMLILYAFFVISVIFIIGAAIELLRKNIIEKPLLKWIDKIIEKFKIRKNIK